MSDVNVLGSHKASPKTAQLTIAIPAKVCSSAKSALHSCCGISWYSNPTASVVQTQFSTMRGE